MLAAAVPRSSTSSTGSGLEESSEDLEECSIVSDPKSLIAGWAFASGSVTGCSNAVKDNTDIPQSRTRRSTFFLVSGISFAAT
jgi:hypothetical protein